MTIFFDNEYRITNISINLVTIIDSIVLNI